MDEDSVKTLLRHVADTPEPAPEVDIAAARRRGRRRLAVRRVAVPAIAMLAVAAIVTAPRGIFSGDGERGVATQARPTVSAAPVTGPQASMPTAAPSRFNPLVPYAAFGWLPDGFSEDAMPLNVGGLQNSGPTEVDRAAVAADGSKVLLAVHARGACAPPAPLPSSSVKVRPTPPAAGPQTACLYATGKAPEVNGRPAMWVPGGIAWQYAPDAWAAVYAQQAAADSGGAKSAVVHSAASAGAAGQLRAMSAATKALVVKVARTVKYAQTAPLLFPFKLTTPLPAGWQLSEMGFHVRAGRLLADALNAGPSADTSALSVAASTQYSACNFVPGQSSYLTRFGMAWEYRYMNDHIAKTIEMLCSTKLVRGLQVNVYLDMAPEVAGAPALPGSKALGGAFGVYEKMKVLGADPANWTASPLG